MDGAADLLVEQDQPGGAIDPRVGADPKLAEEARAGVGGQHLLEVALAPLGAGLDDLAVPEGELDAGDLDAARDSWEP